MSAHVRSIGIGAAMVVIGVLAWRLAPSGTPVVSLPKVGLVVAVLGVVEIIVSTALLALPDRRSPSR